MADLTTEPVIGDTLLTAPGVTYVRTSRRPMPTASIA